MQKFIENLDLGAKGLWFPVIISILLATTALFIRKKNITWREIYITFGVVGFVTWFSDGMIARVIDMFDIGHPKKAGLGDILSYTFIPTSLSILYLNYLTRNNKWKLTIGFTFLSLLVEFGMIHSGYMKYKGWNWYISILTFLLAFGYLLPKHISIIRSDGK
jgi:phosphatidylserine synthase